MQIEKKLIVRYSETDQMGIVHHSNYAVWFEIGRTEYLKQMAESYTEIEKQGILLPVYEMNCKFISPAKYEDDIIVKTKLEHISKVRIFFTYQVVDSKDSRILTTGETKHAWTDKNLNPINAEKLISDIYMVLSKNI